jgi:hypothetical protein
MMTWNGHWGDAVDYQYQHYRHHWQHHDGHRHRHVLQQCPEPPHLLHAEEEGDVVMEEHTSHYNRISVLAIAPQKLFPMIISQVAQSTLLLFERLYRRGSF